MDDKYSDIQQSNEIYEIDKLDYRIIKDFSKIDNGELDNVPLGFFIELSYRYYTIYLNKHLKGVDLTPKQIYILLILSNEDHIPQESIASLLNSNEVTTTREIYNLEKNNYVTRKIDEKDKRKKIVILTEKGKRIVDSITTISNNSETVMNEYVSPEELHILRIILKKLLSSMNEIILNTTYKYEKE